MREIVDPYIRLSTAHPVERREEWRKWKKWGIGCWIKMV